MHTFGIRMLDAPGRAPRQSAIKALAAAEEWLEQQVVSGANGSKKALPGKKQQGKKAAQQQQQDPQGQGQPAEPLSSEVAAALLGRVRLRRMLLEALHLLLLTSVSGLDDAARLCELAAGELPRLEETASLAGSAQAPGFVPGINRKHMGLAPPRPVVPLPLHQAVAQLGSLLSGLAAGCRALQGVAGSWPQLRATLMAFAATEAHPIVRSAVHMQLAKPLLDLESAAAAGAAANAGGCSGGKSGSGKARDSGGGGVPPWCPSKAMVCREFGLSPSDLPGADARMFIEQARAHFPSPALLLQPVLAPDPARCAPLPFAAVFHCAAGLGARVLPQPLPPATAPPPAAGGLEAHAGSCH